MTARNTEMHDCSEYGCMGPQGGVCMGAAQVENQAHHGSASPKGPGVWPQKKWEAYTGRVRRDLLPLCVKKEQLSKALETTPKFEEEVQS